MLKKFLFAMLMLQSVAFCDNNVVIVFDDSGSMETKMRSGKTRMQTAKEALITVMDKIPENSNLGIVTLNRGWVVELGQVDKNVVKNKVGKISSTGGTPLGAYLKIGADSLLKKREKSHYGVYKLLVLSDGEASDSGLVDLYLPDILSRGIVVDVIGVDMNRNHSLATRVNSYKKGDDLNSLTKAVTEVFAESTDKGQDKSDFEILNTMSNDVAISAIKTLGENGNWPIGTSQKKTSISDNGRDVPSWLNIGIAFIVFVVCWGFILIISKVL